MATMVTEEREWTLSPEYLLSAEFNMPKLAGIELLSFLKCWVLLFPTPSLALPRGERGQNPLLLGEGREGVKLTFILKTPRIVIVWMFSSLILALICSHEANADTSTLIESPVHLSQWLNTNPGMQQNLVDQAPNGKQYVPYLPGLLWMVPEEVQEQERMKSQLLDHIKDGNNAPGVSRSDAVSLVHFVESLPITGRVVLERTDPRWLEVNPLHDPLLQKGQRILIPSRPVSVSVVGADGHTCQVIHSVHLYAMDYVRACHLKHATQVAWIIQPDGIVQRRGVAGWNEVDQDPPAPGAWIVTDDATIPWSSNILEQLARLLATQGVAADKDSSNILPQPTVQNELFTGLPVRPRSQVLNGNLLQTPTARMGNAGDASLNFSHTTPYLDINAELQPFDWFEVAFGYSTFSNQQIGSTYTQSYVDKSLDVKFKLLNESALLPQLAMGANDLLGTGLMSGEYVVANKRSGNFDWSMGLGWGYTGARGNLPNPLSIFGSRFSTRQTGSQSATGGQFNISTLFTGRTSLFGGVQYQTPWEPLILKLELDGNNYQHEPFGHNLKQSSPINAGLVYRWTPDVDLTLGWERGTTPNMGLSFHGDLSKLTTPKINDPQPEKVSDVYPTEEPDWNSVANILEVKTSWHVLQIKRAGSEVVVRFERADAVYWNSYLDRIASVLHRYAPGRGVTVFRIQSAEYNLGLHEYLIDRQAWVDSKTGYISVQHRQSTVFEQPESRGFVYPVSSTLVDKPLQTFYDHTGLTYDQGFGGPEGFLYDIGIATKANWYLQPDTWLTGSLAHKLINNYSKFEYLPAYDSLPRVRTYIEQYVSTPGVTMPVLQMTHVGKLDNENFYSVYGGMLEMMYGGVGAEWLYRPWQSTVAFGVDINEVKQRDFKQDFSWLNPQYKIITGHASLYWEGINDINATLKVGRYLAGDRGATLDLSRVFENGVKMGAYATKTNVSAAQFGEGSFDKGIYVKIPFDAFLIRSSDSVGTFNYHPLNRDGGAMLNREVTLKDLTNKQSGNLLKWHPYNEERKTQFGDVPDAFVETSHYSVFNEAGKDLVHFGRAATTWDFWQSMAVIGGISLASAVVDKPIDNRVAKHVNNSGVKMVASLGSDLPFIAMGYAGIAYLTNDTDSRLGVTSYSSLAAGSVGALSSLGIKYVVGRARPSADQGAASFTPVSANNGNTSWPSMHTTVMWAAITPYAKDNDAPWLYGVAALTNVGRVAGRNHWFSDTVAGSLMGYAIGDFMWESHKNNKHGVNWEVSPQGVTAHWKID